MAKRLTVFYSWQSDTPSNLNRNFIEKALHEALKRLHSDATLENALRDATVELERDTKGVAGSPPIVETILGKIEECAVFVADFTFVGESKAGLVNPPEKLRQFPNPNVLIEYGYALRHHSHVALVGIVNTAFGRPDAESLPFDLRHHRWPITYHLSDSSAADRKNQFEKLVETLVEAVGMILVKHSSSKVVVEKFVPQKPSKNVALFFDTPSDLIGDRSESFTIPNGAKAYLRLYPSKATAPIKSELEAKNLTSKGNLRPLGRLNSWGFERNIFGAVVFELTEPGNLYHFTQLFLSREIWGVDARALNADLIRERLQQLGRNDFIRYIPNSYIEEHFVKALQNYMAFAQTHLQLLPPLQIEAGLTGIKGYPLAMQNDYIRGKALQDTISWQDEISSYEKPAWEILAPFFNRIWDNCGFQRPDQQQAALAKGFGDLKPV